MNIDHLIENNRQWASRKTEIDPDFFKRLVSQQSPDYLWIGCSDSRVPANEIVNLDPGEMFVHRNVANQAPPQDTNSLSVIHYAVHVLKVRHIIVVGHYGCGGVKAAIESTDHGLIDHWLTPIRDIAHQHRHSLTNLEETQKLARLVELNVLAQVRNIATNPITYSAWRDGQSLSIHGWVYDLHDGLIQDLGSTISNHNDIKTFFDC
jgi:carbonic anhydrase